MSHPKPAPSQAKPTPSQAKPVEARDARSSAAGAHAAAEPAHAAAEPAAEPADLRLMYSVLARAVRAHAERGDTAEALQLLRTAHATRATDGAAERVGASHYEPVLVGAIAGSEEARLREAVALMRSHAVTPTSQLYGALIAAHLRQVPTPSQHRTPSQHHTPSQYRTPHLRQGSLARALGVCTHAMSAGSPP